MEKSRHALLLTNTGFTRFSSKNEEDFQKLFPGKLSFFKKEDWSDVYKNALLHEAEMRAFPKDFPSFVMHEAYPRSFTLLIDELGNSWIRLGTPINLASFGVGIQNIFHVLSRHF